MNFSGCGNAWVLSCRNMPKVSGACNRPGQSCIDHDLTLSEKSINYQLRSIYDTVPRGTMCCATQTILTGVRDGRSSWKIRVPCCLFRTPKTGEISLLCPRRRSAVIPDWVCEPIASIDEPNTSSIQPPSLSGLLGAFITGLQVRP